MQFSDKLHTALSSLFDSGTVKSTAKSEATDTTENKTVLLSRTLANGLTTITIGTSPLNSEVPTGEVPDQFDSQQAFIDAVLAFIADPDNDIDVTDGVITNTRVEV